MPKNNRFQGCDMFEKGDIVDYHSIIGEPATSHGHTVQSVGRIPSAKEPVAWISGVSGCVSFNALSYSKNEPK